MRTAAIRCHSINAFSESQVGASIFSREVGVGGALRRVFDPRRASISVGTARRDMVCSPECGESVLHTLTDQSSDQLLWALTKMLLPVRHSDSQPAAQ